MQRNISTPLELHELNIVNKTNNDHSSSTSINSGRRNNEPDMGQTTPRKGQVSGVPMAGPRLNIRTTVVSPRRNGVSQSNLEFDENEKLYKLAQKKREINELELKLVQLKKEYKMMEQELKPILNNIHSKAGSTKSKRMNGRGKSENNYSEYSDNVDDYDYDDDDADSSLISISQRIPNKFKENKFVKSLLNKFNEFNVNEDEFDNNVQSQNDSKFYLKEGYNLGEDELEMEAQEEIGFLRRFNKWQNKQINE